MIWYAFVNASSAGFTWLMDSCVRHATEAFGHRVSLYLAVMKSSRVVAGVTNAGPGISSVKKTW